MQKLPPFSLPSAQKKKFVFREPTVADCIEFAGLQEVREEELTTQYLQHLLVDDADPRDWTAEDRRTALWWIWVHINIDSEEAVHAKVGYECPHCKSEHAALIDLRDLDEGVVMLDRLPEHSGSVNHDGKELKFKIKPLTGHELEAIEQLRVERTYLEDRLPEFAHLSAKIRTMELAGCIEFEDEKEDESIAERLAGRVERIYEFPKERTFRPLAQQVMAALSQMRHGLDCIYDEGQVKVVSPLQPCLNYTAPAGDKEGVAPSTALHLSFRPYHFIPAV